MAVRHTRDLAISGNRLGVDRPQDLPERLVTLAVDHDVDRERWVGVCLGREAGVVPADHDAGFRTDRVDEVDQRMSGASLERHDAEPHHGRRRRPYELHDRLAHAVLDQDQIGDRHPMLWIDVPGQRAQRAGRHAHRQRRHVLERIGHRQQQDVHPTTTRTITMDIPIYLDASASRGAGDDASDEADAV